ncbi:MAG: hypothetical protein HUN04_07070 [Desulfobacter sp.]|nr:MAG: hypothetical protein HUN04_07070 [Desulfobacter sp.]
MEIRLDLSRHCIETAARLKAEGLIRSYFKTPDSDTEDRIAALTRFLETADFQELRTRISRFENDPSDPSAKIRKAVLVISKTDPQFEIRLNNQSIYLYPPLC